MTDTGYKCAGKPLHVNDLVAERHMDTSSGQVDFQLTYWKIIQHDGTFWRCICGHDNTEIKLDSDLDLHYSIADMIDIQTQEPVALSSPSVDKSPQNKSWFLAKLAVLALIFYIILRNCTPFLIVANIVAVICAVLAVITLRLHGGNSNDKKV